MGLCFSRPEIDDAANENTALLNNGGGQLLDQHQETPDPYANMTREEIEAAQEEERLRNIERKTTDALVNISQHSDVMHGQSFSNHSHNYEDALQMFSKQIKLPLTMLVGPGESHMRGSQNVDIVHILSTAKVPDQDIALIDDTIYRLLDVISTVHISAPGDCIVPLSLPNDNSIVV